MLGFAEEVKSQLSPTDPSAAMVEVIADQSAEMSAIIEDLLVAARADQGSISVTSEPIDLAQEATVVACALRGRLLSQPVLEVEHTPTLGDPLRLRQIIRNLMTNADRYGGDQTVVTTYHDGGMSVLEVRDNGDALDDEHRERMFEPYTSSGPVRGEPAAMGLGLAVSRTLARLMGGDLVYDHQDGWSVFRLRIPALVTADV